MTRVHDHAAQGEPIVLGGRRFRVLGEGTSAEHDDYMVGALRRAGLVPLPLMTEGETPGDYAARIRAEVAARHETFNLLGGLLVPEGTAPEEWTPELAELTGAHLRKCAEPRDRLAIQNLIVGMLVDFFSDGIASSLISPSSSGTAGASGPGTGEPDATAPGATSSVH